MKRKTLGARLLSTLLALALMMSLAPAALAADCPNGNHTWGEWKVIYEANCHEEGVAERICSVCKKSELKKLDVDKKNHDAICIDNGDGKTHTATCRVHKDYKNVKEEHTFRDGRCTKCLAVDYSEVKLNLPDNLEVYVAVGDDEASISLGDVSLSLGATDVTEDYTLSYNWYDKDESVAKGERYELPASITREEGDYAYVCFVMAVPKGNLNSKPISASRTVTVRVRELVTAYAGVSGEDLKFDLDETNGRTAVSVSQQIYDAVYNISDNYPDYVVFGQKPSSKVGELQYTEGRSYYFDPTGSQKGLDDVSFEPDEKNVGAYVVNFTAYDTKGKSYPGTLTIAVEQSLGELDVLYTTTTGEAVTLQTEDFENFWQETYERGELSRVSFTKLPESRQGSLYYEYSSSARPGSKVKAEEHFYSDPGSKRKGLDEVAFVPDSRFTGYVSIPFEAYGENNRGTQTYLSGDLCVFVSDGEVEEVRYTTGGSVTFSGEDFLDVYREATGSRGSSFYIQLLDVPASGDLYLNYTGNKRDTKLTASKIDAHPFYYSSSRGDEIGDITYVSDRDGADEVRYVAYDAKGEMLYIGTVRFTPGDLTVAYTASSRTGVSFKAADFIQELGVSGSDAYVTFTPPASGTLYFTKTGSASSGAVKVKEGDKYYLENDLMSVNNLLFMPKAGQTGTVSIPFTGYDKTGVVASGRVEITIQAAGYTKSFTDVKKTDWFYTYVMDLAEADVIDGMTPTTFVPAGEVTYGQALKLIMLACGYPEQAPTGKHWASGYLSKALADGLLTTNVPDLDRKITRYAIAEIAAKAMRLPRPTMTSSPFIDMTVNQPYAPYVLALYEAKIVEGTAVSGGRKYYGVNSIVRSEFAKIIWGINSYMDN